MYDKIIMNPPYGAIGPKVLDNMVNKIKPKKLISIQPDHILHKTPSLDNKINITGYHYDLFHCEKYFNAGVVSGVSIIEHEQNIVYHETINNIIRTKLENVSYESMHSKIQLIHPSENPYTAKIININHFYKNVYLFFHYIIKQDGNELLFDKPWYLLAQKNKINKNWGPDTPVFGIPYQTKEEAFELFEYICSPLFVFFSCFIYRNKCLSLNKIPYIKNKTEYDNFMNKVFTKEEQEYIINKIKTIEVETYFDRYEKRKISVLKRIKNHN